ncbi:SapC family protein [Aquincola sp. J276]|uniref:SapC family protein n=1 Tax=Aquincola sp. J276 TaxID=2898432 RepID=UPI0021518353|nr:SapC family protein [Aquincola sp. J276]MCR5863898.1 SapC family protein [Aquincola sp. J276]
MIHPALHKNPVALDRDQHRTLRVRQDYADVSHTAALNSMFLTAVEFADACKEYPIVFVRAGTDPQTQKPDIAPVAVFGLTPDENLFADGTRWQADYVPAVLRAYPFAMAQLNEQNYAMCIAREWPGFSETEGTPLFEADGKPTVYLTEMQQFLEKLELEVQRTRLVGQKLVELELLRDMRFDATLPDGNKLTVDGFLAIDEAKFAALPDDKVLDLHRSGILGLINAHQLSLGNMTRLIQRRGRRTANA